MLTAEKNQASYHKRMERGQKFIKESRLFKQSEFFDLQNTRRTEKYREAKNHDRERDRKANEAYSNVKNKLKDYNNSVKLSPSPKLRQKQGDSVVYNPQTIGTVDDYYPDMARGNSAMRLKQRESAHGDRGSYYREKN